MNLSKLCCTKNVGDRERLLRAILGLFFFYCWASGQVMGIFGTIIGIVGAVFIITAATGCCCLYSMMGKSSCGEGGSCSMDKK